MELNSSRLDPGTIAKRLVSDFGYSPASADLTARDLVGCSQTVWNAFSHWWQTGELGVLEVEGFSVAELVGKHALLAPGAFLMLDWLTNDPAAAKAALARGRDSVGHRPAPSRQ